MGAEVTAILDTRVPPALVPGVDDVVDEADLRRSLRAQIARLEGELGDAIVTAWSSGAGRRRPRRPAPRLLDAAELERTRDQLAHRLSDVRREIDDRGADQELARRRREEMLLDPASHRFARVSNAEVGEPGCTEWEVGPRFGLIGMLMNWWRIRISSGCP